jgi:hypothetical protein
MTGYGSALLLLLGLQGAPSAACSFESEPRVLQSEGNPHQEGSSSLLLWEIANTSLLWSRAGQASEPYNRFLKQLSGTQIETDPVVLLRKKATLPQTSPGDAFNARLAADHADAWISPVNCLEALLMGVQNERIPLLDRSTEFTAFVLESKDRSRIRIYSFTRNQDGIGNAGPALGWVAKDIDAGWSLLGNLHNHNFRPTEADLNAVTAPSISDAEFYLFLRNQHRLQNAWITNGVSTIRVPARDLPKFRGPPPPGSAVRSRPLLE